MQFPVTKRPLKDLKNRGNCAQDCAQDSNLCWWQKLLPCTGTVLGAGQTKLSLILRSKLRYGFQSSSNLKPRLMLIQFGSGLLNATNCKQGDATSFAHELLIVGNYQEGKITWRKCTNGVKFLLNKQFLNVPCGNCASWWLNRSPIMTHRNKFHMSH